MTTNIVALNVSVEWILLIFGKCVILFKTFTRMESRFSCAVIAEKYIFSAATFNLSVSAYGSYFFHLSI